MVSRAVTMNDPNDKKVLDAREHDEENASGDAASIGKGDILQLEHTDPVLNAKMHMVNNAIGTTTRRARDMCGLRS